MQKRRNRGAGLDREVVRAVRCKAQNGRGNWGLDQGSPYIHPPFEIATTQCNGQDWDWLEWDSTK